MNLTKLPELLLKGLHFAFLCCSIDFQLSAQDFPTAAPKVSSFNLQPDNLGTVANSVNLSTGDLNLPINLVSIPGKNGLGIDLTILYHSGSVQNNVDHWNLEAPTGVLGLGWLMSYPMIVADNKVTGARDDDEYYLIEGGSSNKLICVLNGATEKTFKTKTYTNWSVTFTPSNERWRIVKDDGTEYIYGDNTTGRYTVQNVLRWGNWIGNTNISSGTPQAMAWNLAEIRNVWGEKIVFTYTNEESAVGATSSLHTQASYIGKMTDSWGNEAELIYKDKTPDEYQDPHTEIAEPDAYQERYEKKYLDRVVVKTNNSIVYEVRLGYDMNLLGNNALTKRLLKTITKISATGEQLPVTSFDYVGSGSHKGFLNAVSTPTGGSVSFEYHAGLEITNSNRSKIDVTAPSGYKEPTVNIEGDDYVVVTWRQLSGGSHTDSQMPVHAYVYSWDGKWREKDLGSIGNVTMDLHKQDFQIVTRKNFFAILKPSYSGNNYGLFIWRKDEKKTGSWLQNSYTIDLGVHDTGREVLLAGDNFVAVSNGNGKIFRYVWNDFYSWNVTTIDEPVGTRFATATNNYIISHNIDPNPDVITFYYLDAEKKWVTKNISSTFNSTAGGKSYWHSANAFAVVMAKDNNEFIYRWNENYTGFTKHDTGVQFPDEAPVLITGDAQVTMMNMPGAAVGTTRSLRFNGNAWVSSGDQSFYNYVLCSAGNDFFLWGGSSAPWLGYFMEFDPNSSSWKPAQSFSKGSYTGLNQNEAGLNLTLIYGKVRYRMPNGSWSDLGEISTHEAGKPMAGGIPTNRINYIKNGALGPISNIWSGFYINSNSMYIYDDYQFFIGPNTVVTSNASDLDLLNATGLRLYRSIDYNVTGPLTDYPVTKITLNDGIGTFITSYSYDASKALFDPSGQTAMYNKVTVYNGSTSASPYGYTENYFFNGMTEAELGDVFPVDLPVANPVERDKLLLGQLYRTRIYNSSSALVSTKSTFWSVDNISIANSEPTGVGMAYLTTPYKISTITDGIETVKTYGYSGFIKQLISERTHTNSNGTVKELEEILYTYAHTVYPTMASRNMFSQVALVKKRFNGNDVEALATRWKEWPCSGPNCPASTTYDITDSFSWNHTNSSGFTWWDAATQTPSGDWAINDKIIQNTSGFPVETQGRDGQYSCSILDEQNARVFASIAHGRLTQVAYTSFEDNSKGNWTWNDGSIVTGNSKTGEKYMNVGTTGLTKSGVSSTDKFVMSFWAKTNGGSLVIDGVGTVNLGSQPEWKLFQYQVSGNSSYGIRLSGATPVSIDEVKIYPAKSLITTSTYHPAFGQTSATNANEQTSYTTYDSWGRILGLLDENRHIVKSYQYTLKK